MIPPMTKRLIVNADDLGINPQRTHGIFLCFEEGIVRSASVLPNFSDSNQAAKHARERGLSCGLHFNITEGAALCKQADIETLLTPDGFFHARNIVQRLLDEEKIDPMHIEREARAQMEWMFDHYGAPSHLDSHHNVHIHPFVIPRLLPILDRFGIGLVRITREYFETPWEVEPEQLKYVAEVSKKAEEAFALYSAHGIRTTDHFRGLLLAKNASLKNLRHILSRLPEGTTELMVHPGSPTSTGDDFELDPQRQTELRMLTDDTIPELLKTQKIELASFADIL